MQFRAKQQVLIVIVAVVLAIGYVAFRYLPMRRASADLNRKQMSQEALITKAEIKKAELPELQERLEDLEDTLSGFDSMIPVDTQLGQFLSTIAALMDEHDLSEQQIAPHEQIESEELICISVTMKGVGRLEQIRSFCQSLQQLDRVVRIEKFHLVNNSEYSGQVHMETEAIIYRRKPANKS